MVRKNKKEKPAARIDGTLPEQPKEAVFVVGIGASAGGHVPLEQLLTAMPPNCGLSFVVIMHLPPEGPSLLAEMLGRYTSMTVLTAEDGMPLLPDRVQVIPPGSEMIVEQGLLRLAPRGELQGYFHPIDRFFRSLAADAGKRGIAVLLSGFGTDGSEGVRAVSEAGGVVMVQEPGSAINPSMPQNAISTGMASFVLLAEEMAGRIVEIARGVSQPPAECRTSTREEELAAILGIVKARTGHDFNSYKQNTVLRRIERRMALYEVAGFDKYLALLKSKPQEAQALGQEILIGVTSFFRDPEAFETVRRDILPRLFADRSPDDPVRIWHACCATGEEVYSMAMLVREYLDEQRLNRRVQFFATDIDEVAISQARAGIYPDDVMADLGERRRNAFFTKLEGRWQVVKSLREQIVFAHHSLIKDPPFSKLDLLVCRNFLIYLNPDMQKRLISLFHLALKPGGILFLGSSETVERNSGLFASLDKKWKIFERLEGGRREGVLFPYTASALRPAPVGQMPRPAAESENAPLAEAERLVIDEYAPPFVVINDKFEAVFFSNRTGRYLQQPGGRPTRNILKMARQELRPALRTAVYKALTEPERVTFRGVRFAEGEEEETITIRVSALKTGTSAEKLMLLVLEPAAAPQPQSQPLPGTGDEELQGDEGSKDALIQQLEEQLLITHEQLQAATEQLESSQEGFLSSNEEMMSINEEFQSAMEELQSTNEELETSKEELQALNEELVTVNAELLGKVEELNRVNSDMENLFASSEIATIFLDRQLFIKRFSPEMAAIFNLIPADVGRPFRNLAGVIDWSDLPKEAETVLKKLTPLEREVATVGGDRFFLMRVLPYRTIEGAIEGIVVTLLDITERKRTEALLRQNRERFRLLVEGVSDYAIFMLDAGGLVTTWNAGAERIKGYRAEEIIGRHFSIFYPQEDVASGKPDHELSVAQAEGRFEEEGWRVRKDGSRFWANVLINPLRDEQGGLIGFSKITRDLTERKQAEEEISRHIEELRAANEGMTRFNRASVGREMRMIELKKEINELCRQAGLPERHALDFTREES